MSPLITRTAVLLFSLPASVSAERKELTRWYRNVRYQQRVWEQTTRLTIAKVSTAGLPCLPSSSLPTTDCTRPFGEQLQTAVRAVLSQGYEHVIVIGDDCPDLRVSDLRRAAAALESGQLPVGYDQRGGVFLLGLDQRFLTAGLTDTFGRLPWQTHTLGAALTDFMTASFGCVIGLSATRADWNDRADVRAGTWLMGAFAGLARQLWALLTPALPYPFSFSLPSVSDHYDGKALLRGPPAA